MFRTSIAIAYAISISLLPAAATIIHVPGEFSCIQSAIEASAYGDTVLVDTGQYIETINFQAHNILLASRFLFTNDTAYITTTIIDGSPFGTVVTLGCGEDTTSAILGFTIENGCNDIGGGILCDMSQPRISFCVIRRNSAGRGAAIACRFGANPIISHCIITDNSADYMIGDNAGGGIYCEESNPTIANCIISNNMVGIWSTGGAIACHSSEPLIQYCIISGNTAMMGSDGGTIFSLDSSPIISHCIIHSNVGCSIKNIQSSPTVTNCTISKNFGMECGGMSCLSSNATIINSILWNDSSQGNLEIYSDTVSTESITYSDIEGGYPGVGNANIEPMFRDPDHQDYHLKSRTNPVCGDSTDSPLIDAGHADTVDVVLGCFHGLGLDRADMGAYGGGNSGWPSAIESSRYFPLMPREFALFQNYPNPFNSSTVLTYSISHVDKITLTICNILGQRVAVLMNGYALPGTHRLLWDASDLSSGIYFVRMQSGKSVQTRKVVLLK